MHPLTALYDPFGSCYDKVPSVAGGEAAAAKPLGGGLGSPLAEPSFHGAIISETLLLLVFRTFFGRFRVHPSIFR